MRDLATSFVLAFLVPPVVPANFSTVAVMVLNVFAKVTKTCASANLTDLLFVFAGVPV